MACNFGYDLDIKPQKLLFQSASQNDIRPLTDGFDIDFNNRNDNSQTNKEDVTLSDPGNCDALGLESTFEKVLDFTYERGNKQEIELDRDIGNLQLFVKMFILFTRWRFKILCLHYVS